MIQKKYTSFEEIDKDLKVLKLKRQIQEEKVKLTVRNLKSEFYPVNILGGIGPLIQKIAITMIAKKVLNKIT